MKNDLTFDRSYGRLNIRVAVLVEHNGRVLIQKHRNKYWLIGGRIHFGEDSRTAIIREIAEELCYTISDHDSLYLNFICENFFTLGKTKCHEMLFIYRLVLGDDSELIHKDNFKCGDNDYFNEKWVAFDDLPKKRLVPTFIKEQIRNREFQYVLINH